MSGYKHPIAVVALGFWTLSLTLGAMRVILPVYFVSVGVGVSKIALLFVLLKAAEILGPMAEGLIINRLGYKRSFIGSLALHSVISCLYIFKPTLAFIYLERFVRGLLALPLLSSVYVKHFSLKDAQRFHINMMKGMHDAAKGVGMFAGGVLIAVLPIEYSITILGLLTAGATIVALRNLPDLKEELQAPILGIWGSVNRKIKTLGIARGLLHGASDSWGMVILPVYLTVIFGLSPAAVGTIMMAGLVFNGISVTLISKYVKNNWEPEKSLVVCGLLLLPVCLAMAAPMPLYSFLAFVFLYKFVLAANAVYYNELKLEFSTEAQTSIDLATYKTISSSVPPIAIWVSGFLAEALGFSWPFYLSSVLVLFSVLVLLGLARSAPERVGVMEAGVRRAVVIKE